MENLKYSVWVIWIGSLSAMLFGGGWVAIAGHFVFWVTLLAHLAEFVAQRSLFQRAGGSMAQHFVQTLIYGLFHWTPIRQRLADGEQSK
jgi:hypothetical protein